MATENLRPVIEEIAERMIFEGKAFGVREELMYSSIPPMFWDEVEEGVKELLLQERRP